jgi:hypothetical protein
MKMDKHERKEFVKKATQAQNIISCGITHIEGRAILKKHKKQALSFLSVCHYSGGVFAITPLDYDYPTMVTQIRVAPVEDYCEKAHVCLCFHCRLNKFDKGLFIDEFKDCGGYSLGLPQNLGRKPLWFNDGKWLNFWRQLIIQPDGGVIRYDEKKAKELGV